MIIGAIILALVYFVFMHQKNMKIYIYKARIFCNELDSVWKSFREVIRGLPGAMANFKEYNKHVQTIVHETVK
jgi:hypothetical protein